MQVVDGLKAATSHFSGCRSFLCRFDEPLVMIATALVAHQLRNNIASHVCKQSYARFVRRWLPCWEVFRVVLRMVPPPLFSPCRGHTLKWKPEW